MSAIYLAGNLPLIVIESICLYSVSKFSVLICFFTCISELKTGQFSEKNHVKVTKSELTCENVKTEYVEGDSHTHLTNNHKEEREVIEKGHQYIKCDDIYLRDEDILKDYLQLDVNLELLYQTWAQADKHFEEISKTFTGIRMLRQEPIECLFSFICSSNNNISRITSMVEKLASNYGEKILTLDGKEYYSFPRVVALAQDGVEERLKELGFGYRAKYIQVMLYFTRLQLFHVTRQLLS